MALVACLVIGLLAGAIVRVASPQRNPGGWGTAVALGQLGAVIGGLVALILTRQSSSVFWDERVWLIALALGLGAPALRLYLDRRSWRLTGDDGA